jgi:ABC-2 type transport system ATP-binding protein
VTILLVTHFMEEAERLCDRVAVINHGRVVANDTVVF